MFQNIKELDNLTKKGKKKHKKITYRIYCMYIIIMVIIFLPLIYSFKYLKDHFERQSHDFLIKNQIVNNEFKEPSKYNLIKNNQETENAHKDSLYELRTSNNHLENRIRTCSSFKDLKKYSYGSYKLISNSYSEFRELC